MNIPAVTTEQMREVDRLMRDVYDIALLQMMESAGRHLAALARRRFLGADPMGKNVQVLVGSGGNGGGGLVAARRLHNWGADVRVFTSKRPVDLTGVPGHQLSILNKMQVPVYFACDLSGLPPADLIVDAIIGYSLRGTPARNVVDLIQKVNQSTAPVLSLDLPSGMDATSGQVFDDYIRATATLTLALPKIGLLQEAAKPIVGELYLADISVPPQLYAHLGLSVEPIFSVREIIRIY